MPYLGYDKNMALATVLSYLVEGDNNAIIYSIAVDFKAALGIQ